MAQARQVIEQLRDVELAEVSQMLLAMAIEQGIKRVLELAPRVVGQTERRVLRGEAVAATDKIVSIFEPHTDIIVKDRRETLYGHKVCLTSGASGLVLDLVVQRGNPADSTLARPMVARMGQRPGVQPARGRPALARLSEPTRRPSSRGCDRHLWASVRLEPRFTCMMQALDAPASIPRAADILVRRPTIPPRQPKMAILGRELVSSRPKRPHFTELGVRGDPRGRRGMGRTQRSCQDQCRMHRSP